MERMTRTMLLQAARQQENGGKAMSELLARCLPAPAEAEPALLGGEDLLDALFRRAAPPKQEPGEPDELLQTLRRDASRTVLLQLNRDAAVPGYLGELWGVGCEETRQFYLLAAGPEENRIQALAVTPAVFDALQQLPDCPLEARPDAAC